MKAIVVMCQLSIKIIHQVCHVIILIYLIVLVHVEQDKIEWKYGILFPIGLIGLIISPFDN